MGKILGIDYGARRTGLALSDADCWLASPLRTVHGEASLLGEIANLVEKENLQAVVVGLPLNMDGSEGPRAKETRAFCQRLDERLAALRPDRRVSIELWDERLTSVQAERSLRSGGVRASRRRERLDSVAAQILLQSYLDSRRSADRTS